MSLKIISTFGDHSSLYPLATKDIINSIGMTAYSYEAAGSDKNTKLIEAKDRFIDEFGTEAIWLGGLPFFKWLANKTIYKAKGYNPDVDVRLINDKNQLEVAKKYADSFSKKLNMPEIANDLLKAEKGSKLFKGLFMGKFFAATALTLASYFTLTVLKQKYTDKQVLKKELEKLQKQEQYNKNIKNNPAFKAFTIGKQNQSFAGKNPSFKGFGGLLNTFMFNPVHNMFIVDAGITSERLAMARNKHEFMEYAIKEGSLLFFLYIAGKYIQQGIEHMSDKLFNKPIKLHADFMNSDTLKNAMKNDTVKSHLDDFNALKNGNPMKTEQDIAKYKKAIYEFIYDEKNADNLVVRAAKKSGIISVIDENPKKLNALQKFINIFKISEKPEIGKVNPHQYIDTKDITNLADHISDFVKKQKASGKSVEEFLKTAKQFKVGSVIGNIGISCLFLGFIVPKMMKAYKDKYYGEGSHIQQGIQEKIARMNFGQNRIG